MKIPTKPITRYPGLEKIGLAYFVDGEWYGDYISCRADQWRRLHNAGQYLGKKTGMKYMGRTVGNKYYLWRTE